MKSLVATLARSTSGAVLLALFCLLTLYPVVRFLLVPILPALGTGTGIENGVPISSAALINTIRIGLESTLWAVAVGMALGFVFERRRWPGRGPTMMVLWLIFLTPSYLITTGWQIFFAEPALAHGAMARAFFSEAGIVLLLGLKGLPFATLAARTSWHSIGAELADAASLHIKSAWRRHSTILELLFPAAAAAFAIVFVESIQEFGIPATLGAQIHLPIITYAIYERLATTPIDFSGAAALSWQLVGLAVFAAAIQLYLAGRYASALVHARRRTVPPARCGRIEAGMAWLGLAALAALGVAIPGASVVTAALAPVNAAAPPIQWDSLLYSTLYAIIAALLSVAIVAPVLLRQRASRGRFSRALGALSLANMALPGVVLGAAYLIAFNSNILPLYGTPLLLVIAYVAVQVPMLLRFLQAPVEQIHPNLSEAARLHGVPWSARLLDVEGPLLARPFMWGWMMAFGQIFFELPISELLYPAGRPPVGVVLVTLNQSLHYSQEARLALGAIAASLVVAGLAAALVSRAASVQLAREPA